MEERLEGGQMCTMLYCAEIVFTVQPNVKYTSTVVYWIDLYCTAKCEVHLYCCVLNLFVLYSQMCSSHVLWCTELICIVHHYTKCIQLKIALTFDPIMQLWKPYSWRLSLPLKTCCPNIRSQYQTIREKCNGLTIHTFIPLSLYTMQCVLHTLYAVYWVLCTLCILYKAYQFYC